LRFRKGKDKKASGRFQLVPATIQVSVKGEQGDVKCLFKIDTNTGTTWICRLGKREDGKIINEWVLIPGGTADDPLGIRQ